MEPELVARIMAYEARHRVRIGQALGDGLHGRVFVVRDNSKGARSAAKFHRWPDPFEREVAVYERLRDEGISRIRGFNVPLLLQTDPDLLAIQMTIVDRPYVLDFAAARLDAQPDFPENVWEEWESERAEVFGGNWPEARRVSGHSSAGSEPKQPEVSGLIIAL
jgi:hypothetical protein